MLINLSNHPSDKWSEKQKQVATAQFGAIRDMPFPNIPPEIDIKGVAEIALQQIALILQSNKTETQPTDISILLNGEQSFLIVFYLLATKNELPCYVATSERNTVMNEDGSKTVQFNFVQFRKI